MAKKTQLSYKEIEEHLRQLKEHTLPADEIGYSLLYAFGKGERDIVRMREGKGIIKTFEPGLLIKGEFCYRATTTLRLVAALEELKADTAVRKAAPKIIAVSDGKTIRAYDLRQQESFEQQIDRLYCDFEFFYPLAGVERIEYVEESPADIKAAEKLAKLHDEIRAYNEFTSDSDLHDLNIFIARLLFCFFAEDTGIFEPSIFTGTIKQYTLDDGSDLNQFLDDAFFAMATEEKHRPADLPSFIRQFPFVRGGLFTKLIQLPQLSARARKIIIECGDLDWQNINPDIFGSMIQAVVNPDERATQGMHYTSVPNIMKVINPLFLDELTEEKNRLAAQLDEEKKLLELTSKNSKDLKKFYDKGQYIKRSCRNLLRRIAAMKFFDPACGSGNFLIITYKQLRLLELDILAIIRDCQPEGLLDMDILQGTVIKLNQFYGIELLDFPHEIAMLSLWLAEHQMNRKLYQDFGVVTNALPLKDITQIKCGNACRVDWNEVCPHTKEEEVFIFGNPPYLGSRRQDEEQKKDLEILLHDNFGELDYIACWFVAGGNYVRCTKSKLAFVTTNSICQGLQVSLLWKKVLFGNLTINFAYSSFKWKNNAKHNAGVTCNIVGVADSLEIKKKLIYNGETAHIASNISPYLLDAPTTYVDSASRPLCSGYPIMNFGNMPADGGKLIISPEERKQIIHADARTEKYIRPLIGAEEFINGKQRFCIWLKGVEADEYTQIDEFRSRIADLHAIRLKSSRPQLAEISHLFAQITQPMNCPFILIPRVSSEARWYIPIGFYESGPIAADSCMVIGTESISLFGLLTSRIHMDWVRAVGGRLETRYRYSAGLCYNTFPFPKISDSKKSEIEEAATEILLTREPYLTVGKTLADLYDPDTMPDDLREAHARLDDIVESCYPGYPFASDEARLECLFKMYEKMTKK